MIRYYLEHRTVNDQVLYRVPYCKLLGAISSTVLQMIRCYLEYRTVNNQVLYRVPYCKWSGNISSTVL